MKVETKVFLLYFPIWIAFIYLDYLYCIVNININVFFQYQPYFLSFSINEWDTVRSNMDTDRSDDIHLQSQFKQVNITLKRENIYILD